MSADEVVAVVGGSTWRNWTAYQVASDILTPADAFTLEVANPTSAQISAVSEGAAITLMVGTTTILQGWIDEKRFSGTRAGDTLTLSGRDAGAPLVDCSVPLRWTWKKISLAQLASNALGELGIGMTVTADADAQAVIAYVKPEPGETFWELLDREARRLRLMLWTAADGLHLGRPDYTSAPVGTLRRHVVKPASAANNVKSADVTWRTSGRRSAVTVVGQAPGADDLYGGSAQRLVGNATDADMVALGLVRPLVMQDGAATSTTQAQARADWEVSRRKGDAFVGVYAVSGHRPSASLVWDVDQVVSVVDERADVQGDYWIAARDFTRSREGGTQTRLTLRTLGAILPAVA